MEGGEYGFNGLTTDIRIRQERLQFGAVGIHTGLEVSIPQRSMILRGGLIALHQGFGLVAQFGHLDLLLVFLGVEAGFLAHPLHFRGTQAPRVGNLDTLRPSRSFIQGRHIQDTVGINIKGDFNLRHAPRRRGNSRKLKFP